jgi:hypothetical protein
MPRSDLPQNSVAVTGVLGAGNALEVLGSEVLKLKQIAKKLSGPFGNDYCVWPRNALQARC